MNMLAIGFTSSNGFNRLTQRYQTVARPFCGVIRWAMVLGLGVIAAGCGSSAAVPPRSLPVQQQWELKIGQPVGQYQVSASLGDVSIELNGSTVFAPFAGEVEPMENGPCVLFSTPDVPAYLFRLCGLEQPRLGPIEQGQSIGKGRYLHFATLRLQPDGNWAIVEPASDILTRLLTRQSD
ncbi:MAG: hypothetical protein AAGF66_15720 [Cyanobacteria bacterium P01_H01_bin.119]